LADFFLEVGQESLLQRHLLLDISADLVQYLVGRLIGSCVLLQQGVEGSDKAVGFLNSVHFLIAGGYN